MHRFNLLLATIFGLLLLFDGVTVFRLWWYGIPMSISMTSEGESFRLLVESVPFTGADLIILVLWLAVHVLLIYLVRKSWRSSQVSV